MPRCRERRGCGGFGCTQVHLKWHSMAYHATAKLAGAVSTGFPFSNEKKKKKTVPKPIHTMCQHTPIMFSPVRAVSAEPVPLCCTRTHTYKIFLSFLIKKRTPAVVSANGMPLNTLTLPMDPRSTWYPCTAPLLVSTVTDDLDCAAHAEITRALTTCILDRCV